MSSASATRSRGAPTTACAVTEKGRQKCVSAGLRGLHGMPAGSLSAGWSNHLRAPPKALRLVADPTAIDHIDGMIVAALRMLLSLINGGRSLILFDEMEDLLSASWGRRRAHVHRLLETNRTPILWTANDIGDFGPAALRRFSYALEIKAPSAKVRRTLWKRELHRYGFKASQSEVEALARDFDIPPAIIATAARSASLSSAEPLAARQVAEVLLKAMAGGVGPRVRDKEDAGDFDPLLINADCDVAGLVARLSANPRCRFSICVSGPSGTGKSAFVRYLAGALDLPVSQRRASDLLAPFVGVTESRIALAFAEAKQESSLLVFDEVDSLLADRAEARHSWEVTQVNEMLTWMECHPLPFACTTNLMDRLDPASLRRFTFRISFGYLTRGQCLRAYKSSFGALPNLFPHDLEALTPGDFSVVKRQVELLGTRDAEAEIIARLRAESAAKPSPVARIGY